MLTNVYEYDIHGVVVKIFETHYCLFKIHIYLEDETATVNGNTYVTLTDAFTTGVQMVQKAKRVINENS